MEIPTEFKGRVYGVACLEGPSSPKQRFVDGLPEAEQFWLSHKQLKI